MKDNDNKKSSDEATNSAFLQGAVIRRFYFLLVKWLLLKPLVKLSYIINGKMMGDVKWYQRHFTTPVRWKWLNNVTYKLTKYIMFS